MPSESHWGFPIALYLFVGGMSASAYYVGVIADIVSNGRYRNVARIGSYLVLVPITIGLVLLLADLGNPSRFWHLLFQNGPLVKGLVFFPESAMSLGVWILNLFFVICGVIYPAMWLAEENIGKKLPLISGLVGKESLRKTVGLIGLPFAILVAAYTGVLLAATAKPVLADTPLLPVLFVLSATSTGIAAIVLFMSLSGKAEVGTLARLEKGDNLIIKLELTVVAILFIALFFSPGAVGTVTQLVFGSYSVLFWLGFIIAGLLLPLFIQTFSLKNHGNRALAIVSSMLVLFGGFYLRYLILLAA